MTAKMKVGCCDVATTVFVAANLLVVVVMLLVGCIRGSGYIVVVSEYSSYRRLLQFELH